MNSLEKSSPLYPVTTVQQWTATITPEKPFFNVPIRELWKYRGLVYLLTRRDLITANKQTLLGPLWFFIQPLISTVVFNVIFRRVVGIPTNGIPPFLFFMSGVILWYYCSACTSRAAGTFSSNMGLFNKVYFPRLAVPIAQMVVNAWHFFIQFLMFLGFYAYFLYAGADIHTQWQVVFIPLFILQMGLLGTGVGLIICALTTKYRDLALAVAPGMQLWMYASCIFYPRSQVPPNLQWLMDMNPVVPIIESFRYVVTGQGHVALWEWLLSLGLTILIIIVGLIGFSRAEKTFADTI